MAIGGVLEDLMRKVAEEQRKQARGPGNRFQSTLSGGFSEGALKRQGEFARRAGDDASLAAQNQTRQAFRSRGIPSARIADAIGIGTRARAGTIQQLTQPLEIESERLSKQGQIAGAGLDVNMFDIIRRRQDAIKAAEAGKQKGFNFGIPGIGSFGVTA